jgi:hypothetical protein
MTLIPSFVKIGDVVQKLKEDTHRRTAHRQQVPYISPLSFLKRDNIWVLQKKKVLRRIFGTKRDEVTGGWEKIAQ